jgi:hypothetical protein
MRVASRFGHDWNGIQRDGGVHQGEQAGAERAVEDLPALTPVGDKTRLAERHQVLRDVGLSVTQSGLDLADAYFAPAQQVQDLQPGGVGDGAEQLGKGRAIRHGNHIQDVE